MRGEWGDGPAPLGGGGSRAWCDSASPSAPQLGVGTKWSLKPLPTQTFLRVP